MRQPSCCWPASSTNCSCLPLPWRCCGRHVGQRAAAVHVVLQTRLWFRLDPPVRECLSPPRKFQCISEPSAWLSGAPRGSSHGVAISARCRLATQLKLASSILPRLMAKLQSWHINGTDYSQQMKSIGTRTLLAVNSSSANTSSPTKQPTHAPTAPAARGDLHVRNTSYDLHIMNSRCV